MSKTKLYETGVGIASTSIILLMTTIAILLSRPDSIQLLTPNIFSEINSSIMKPCAIIRQCGMLGSFPGYYNIVSFCFSSSRQWTSLPLNYFSNGLLVITVMVLVSNLFTKIRLDMLQCKTLFFASYQFNGLWVYIHTWVCVNVISFFIY